jgi:cell division protease FtsH
MSAGNTGPGGTCVATPESPLLPGATTPAPSPTKGERLPTRLKARLVQWRRGRAARGRRGPSGLVLSLVASLLLLLVAFGASLSYLFADPKGDQVGIDAVERLAAGSRVFSATFLDEDDQVVLLLNSVGEAEARQQLKLREITPPGAKPPVQPPAHIDGVTDGSETVRAALSESGTSIPHLTEILTQGGARVSFDHQSTQAKVRLVTEFLLPVLILANIFALLFVGKGGGSNAIGDVTNFGRVDDSARTGGSHVTFADVGGADEAVIELAEVRDYLRDPAKYKALGAAPPKGVLLFGPPGTGKTLLARAVAGEAGVPFFSVAGAEFVESLVGVGAARIRDLFKRVRAVAPAIVFIDELDAAGRKRGAGGGGGGSDEREQTLNQLLVEMDGFEVTSGIVVIAATNRPDILDPALMRPGRFDRHITVERPDHEGRERILAIHANKKPLAPDVDLSKLADRCPGFTGADLASVVNEAALLTIRQGGSQIHMKELEEAVVRVLEGPQRRGRVLTPEERLRAAYHEIGHIVVAATLGRHEDIHRVTVLSRGRTVAAATFGDAEATLLTRSSLHKQLVATLGGIAAEELVLGEGSTGAEQDLEHATDLARDMVTRYGMSDAVGPIRLQVKAGEGFLGDDTTLVDLSDETQREVEKAVRQMVEEAREEAKGILRAHRRQLDSLATRLDAEETLEGEVLERALAPLMEDITTPVNGVEKAPVRRTTAAKPRVAKAPHKATTGRSSATSRRG